ncbi:hypothetical protein Glove_78g44 [Diversispora epigaea]|uniref:Uncharacterized protein n=1 Tax=Diversispora epigaea TaxID=1348612 RepID=A0A397J9H3_9GLOM|nr:hypothetical protein Glove_78g44 [Diversispora epigaea]
MWSCLNKCPCFHFRSESQPPFDQYYDDEDNLEFEHLLAQQDAESIAAFLSRAPFSRSTNTPNYFSRTSTVLPIEEASASTNRLLLDDDENLQTQDAQFLPDEQISKFTELISEQVKYNQSTDVQLAAEEEEAKRQEEEEYERQRQAAQKAAIAKGLISNEQTNITSNFFTIEDEEDDDGKNYTDSSNTIYSMNDDGTSVEMSVTASQKKTSNNINNNNNNNNNDDDAEDDSEQIESYIDVSQNESSLNKSRNAHERIYAKDVNLDDYETDFEDTSTYDRRSTDSSLERNRSRRSIIRDIETRRKVEEDYSPFSVGILQSDNFEEDYYSPIVATPTTNTFRGEIGNHYFEEEEEIDYPFANILPNFSERLGKFFNGITKRKSKEIHNNNNNNKDNNNNNNNDDDDDDDVNLNDYNKDKTIRNNKKLAIQKENKIDDKENDDDDDNNYAIGSNTNNNNNNNNSDTELLNLSTTKNNITRNQRNR